VTGDIGTEVDDSAAVVANDSAGVANSGTPVDSSADRDRDTGVDTCGVGREVHVKGIGALDCGTELADCAVERTGSDEPGVGTGSNTEHGDASSREGGSGDREGRDSG